MFISCFHHLGLWLFHCHNSFHSELGQIVVFKVGDEEDWGPPPQDFPRCGSFGTIDAPKGCPTSTGKHEEYGYLK